MNEVNDLSDELYAAGVNCFNDISFQLEQKQLNLSPIEKLVLYLVMDYRDQSDFLIQQQCREEDYIDAIEKYLNDLSLDNEYFDFLLSPFDDEKRYEIMRFHSLDTWRFYAEEIIAPRLRDSIDDNRKFQLIKLVSSQSEIYGKYTDDLNFTYDNKYVETIAEELNFNITARSDRLDTALNNAKGGVVFEVVLISKNNDNLHYDLKK